MTRARRFAFAIVPVVALIVMVAGRGARSPHDADIGDRPVPVDSTPPTGEARLLFFQGRSTVESGDERVFVTDGGRLAVTDARLRLRYLSIDGLDAATTSIAPARDAGWWLSDANGQLLRIDSDGRVAARHSAPFAASAIWPHSGGGIVAARSPERFTFNVEATDAPMLAIMQPDGATVSVGTANVPEHALLTGVANAGHVVSLEGVLYFAPLGRRELLAMNSTGELIWRTASPDSFAEVEPRFVVENGTVRIDHAPQNLALTVGPDGHLYRLRARDTSAQSAVLDIVSRESGHIMRSISVGSSRLTLAVAPTGQLHLLNDATLLGAVAPRDRERMPVFDWPSRDGARVASSDLQGQVVLINVWASWCTPCKREMPALDSLQKQLEGETFSFIALNADAQQADADAFLTQFAFTFPVVYGGAQSRAVFQYPGLPYTLLIDKDGRVMQRWAGQLMPSHMEQIHALVRAEQLRLTQRVEGTGHGDHGSHH